MVYKIRRRTLRLIKIAFTMLIVFVFIIFAIYKVSHSVSSSNQLASTTSIIEEIKAPIWPAILDKDDYDNRILVLNNYVPPATTTATGTVATSTLIYGTSTNVTIIGKKWPTSTVYPNGDAILPFKRILAYYGNFYSTKMGILGEYEPDEVLQRLASTTEKWNLADPTTPVLPAIEYIAMVAQGSAGKDGMYRAQMPDVEIDKAHSMAQKINGILILDLQVGLSTIQKELPKFKKYMEKKDIHLAIDPEFSMKTGKKPGTVIGSVNSEDINYVITYLSDIVRENKLPPKVLLIHRFTEKMVMDAKLIKPTPEVQVIIVMDGWGSKELKRGTYKAVIDSEPVQFTGIKIFYKNDLKGKSTGMLTPNEVLNLKPKPIFVQYQ